MLISLSTPLLIFCASHGVLCRTHTSRPREVRARSEARLSKKCFSIGSVCVDVVTVPNVGNCIKVYVLCKKIPAVVAFGIKLPQFSNLFINFDVYCL